MSNEYIVMSPLREQVSLLSICSQTNRRQSVSSAVTAPGGGPSSVNTPSAPRKRSRTTATYLVEVGSTFAVKMPLIFLRVNN